MKSCINLAHRLTFVMILGLGLSWLAPAQVQNQNLQIKLDERGAIMAIVDQATGKNFIQSGVDVPLYSMTLIDRQGSRRTITSTEAVSVVPKLETGGRSLSIIFKHEQPYLTARLSVRVPQDGNLSYWRLDVENGSPLSISGVDFPGFALPQVLSAAPDKTELIFPHSNNDQRYWNLPEEFQYVHRHTNKTPNQPIAWPLSLCDGYAPDVIQMMALYDERAGIYLATHDSQANVKHYEAVGLSPQAMRLRIEHLRPWGFGKNFEMGYDVAIGVFHGDWTAAADIYREWAEHQPWCAAGKLGKKDTPEWVLRYPTYFRFVLQHPNVKGAGRTPWPEFPARLARLEQEQPELFPGAMVHFVDFDIGGYWQGFYNERWPAWMGDAAFAARIRELGALGLHPKTEPFGWHISAKDENRPDYNLRLKPFWSELLNKTLVWSDADALHEGGPLGRGPTHACVGSRYGQSVFADDARRTAPWGMDMIQIMEIGLARRMQCYNPNHQHPPGPGPWIFQDAFKAFKTMRETGQASNPEFATDKEETAEYLIPVLDTCYERNAQMKNMRWNGRPQFYKNNVPLFDYVYHQYLTLLDGFQANSPESARWCAGIAAVQGHLTGPLFGPDPNKRYYREAQSSGAWKILAQAHKAYNSYARPYVIFGRVLPPPGVEFPEIHQPRQSVGIWQQVGRGKEAIQTAFLTPAVVQSAHQAPDGAIGLSFINVSEAAVDFTLNPGKYKSYLKTEAVKITAYHNGEVIAEKTGSHETLEPLKLKVDSLAFLFVTIQKT